MSDESIGRAEARRLLRKFGFDPDAQAVRPVVGRIAKLSPARAKSKLRRFHDDAA